MDDPVGVVDRQRGRHPVDRGNTWNIGNGG
jgi:hypothetical protein